MSVATSDPTTLVGGTWGDPDERREVANPADGSVVGSVGYGGAAEARAAADAAGAAFAEWADTPARGRADVLLRAGALLAERADAIAELLAREAGKRLPEAAGEVGLSAEYFRWFAEEARRPAGQLHPHEQPGRRHLSIRRPAGVVASLTPWNFPVSIQARKLAPALAAGCTVVARPSEKAPLAAVELVRCLQDAGLPDGVLNLVHGPAAEVTDALLVHAAVRVVSFTGSTGVGRQVMAAASGASCARCSSWAATRRSSSSRTPTSTRPSRARWWPSSATRGRAASGPTASSCTSTSTTSSSSAWPSGSTG